MLPFTHVTHVALVLAASNFGGKKKSQHIHEVNDDEWGEVDRLTHGRADGRIDRWKHWCTDGWMSVCPCMRLIVFENADSALVTTTRREPKKSGASIFFNVPASLLHHWEKQGRLLRLARD